MAARNISDGLLLVKAAATGDVVTKVTALTGWTDLSAAALTMSIDTSRNTNPVTPYGTNNKARVIPGSRAGSMSLTLLRDDGATPDPAKFFEDIDDANGRFSFCVQQDRTATLVSNAVVPKAAATNPQYAGSAVITALETWGDGSPDSPAIISITADLDRDYARYWA